MRKLCQTYAPSKRPIRYVDRWRPGLLRPDLNVTWIQPAVGGPQNLVLPLSFEPELTAVEKELRRTWDDVTFRCRWKAELRAAGVNVPMTREQAGQVIEVQSREVKEARKQLKRVQVLNQVKPPLLRPAHFGHVQIKRIKVCGAYLQSLRPQTVLFTGTFNSHALGKLAKVAGGGGQVVSNFNREVSRRMKRKGHQCLWIGVVEIGMKRWETYGEPGLHYHFLLVNKKNARYSGDWILSGEDLQEIWDSSIRKVLGEDYANQTSRTETKPVKKDVVGYLSKYLTKSEELGAIDWTDWQGIVPRQWVYTSGDLRKAIKLHSLSLPGEFGDWLAANSHELRRKKLCFTKEWAPDDKPIGLIRQTQFISVKALAICIAQFEKDKRRYFDHFFATAKGDSAEHKFDPLLHAGLPVPAVDLETYNLRTCPVLDSRRLPDQIRETFETLFRDVDIPEPVFVGISELPVEGTRQTELFRGGTLLSEVQLGLSDVEKGPPHERPNSRGDLSE